MRVIRTEIFFDDKAVSGASRIRRLRYPRALPEEINHGIAFAWFRNDGDAAFNIRNHKWFHGQEIAIEQVDRALDLLIRDEGEREIFHLDEPSQNPAVVHFVFDQDIVLEHSPPFAIPFKGLLKQTNAAVLLGAYIGHSIAGDDPLLMILTIPGGIIVVGSALGIADAMAYGLNKQIKRMFDRK